mmetsp:Transcript_12907/g.31034  ORF Transcript_12907/g.31034 Transcript_12907/m.31034 type:complete len:232 (-) Transcript_12907:170-865(-)
MGPRGETPANVGNFTSIVEATPKEFAKSMVGFTEVADADQLAARAIGLLKAQKGIAIGNMIDLYEHGLQTATRAHRDGADEETVVCALLHDVGELLVPNNHGEISAALLRPFISPQNYWILAYHEIFQAFYYQDAANLPEKNTRERFQSSPHYEACVRFCEKWDQTSFDPDYKSEPLEFFEPMVKRIFKRTPFWHPDHDKDELASAKKAIGGGYPVEGHGEEPVAKKAKTQ